MAATKLPSRFDWTDEMSSRSSSPEAFDNNFSDDDDDDPDNVGKLVTQHHQSSQRVKGKILSDHDSSGDRLSNLDTRNGEQSLPSDRGYSREKLKETSGSDTSIDGHHSPVAIDEDEVRHVQRDELVSIAHSKAQQPSGVSAESFSPSATEMVRNPQVIEDKAKEDYHMRSGHSKTNVGDRKLNDSGPNGMKNAASDNADTIESQTNKVVDDASVTLDHLNDSQEAKHIGAGICVGPHSQGNSKDEISWEELEELEVRTGLKSESDVLEDRMSPIEEASIGPGHVLPYESTDTGMEDGTDNEPCEEPSPEHIERWQTEGWCLSWEELQGPSMVLDDLIEVDDAFLSRPLAGEHGYPKSKRQKFPRVFHSRADPNSLMGSKSSGNRASYRLMSPLTRLGNMAKKMKVDVAEMLENLDQLGMNMQMSCMQCYEKYGRGSVDADYGYEDDEYAYGQTVEGRCKRCGGQVSTLKSVGQAIMKLRQKMLANDLEPYDVYPDGNCMFGAVVDQLRVRGDFRFTIHNLRHAAVEYLRRNPNADDGTPYAMFMVELTWEEYLSRMSEDGEWGDHMVLSAISNLLSCRIVIYGGISGDGFTVICPTGQAPDELMGNGEDDSKESSISKKGASCPGDNGCQLEIYLGHIGESHYISLRPKNWEPSLERRITEHRTRWQNGDVHTDSQSWTLPLIHVNFLLKLVYNLRYITGIDEEHSGFTENNTQTGKALYDYVGPYMTQLLPTVSKIESITPDINVFFGPQFHSTPEEDKPEGARNILTSPLDTKAVFDKASATNLDLIVEKIDVSDGFVRLIPKRSRLWEGQTVLAENGNFYLQWLNGLTSKKVQSVKTWFSYDFGFKCAWPGDASEWLIRARPAQWPTADKVEAISNEGCHVMPYTGSDVGSKIDDRNIVDYTISLEALLEEDYADSNLSSAEINSLTWIYSFAVAERELSRCLSLQQKFCFHWLKLMTDKIVPNPKIPPSILKSVFFHACENIPSFMWEGQPGDCFLILLKKLNEGLNIGHIPHYFLSNGNLLRGIERSTMTTWHRELDRTIAQPVISLYFLLDKHKLTVTEIGPYLDDIVEDMFRFSKHSNIQKSISEVIFPAGYVLLSNLILQGEYSYSKAIAVSLKEQSDSLGLNMTYGGIISKCAWDTNIGYVWCLALYMDLTMGTLVTKEVCDGYQTVPVTEVFGPEILEELPNTVVPATFQIPNGQLRFPTEVVLVLQKLGNSRLLIKCIRYYIDTYNDIAGDQLVISSSTNPATASAFAYLLQDLYVLLFNAYYSLNMCEEFRDLMGPLTKLTESGLVQKSASTRTNLRRMWQCLGEYDKAKEYSSAAASSNIFEYASKALFGSVSEY